MIKFTRRIAIFFSVAGIAIQVCPVAADDAVSPALKAAFSRLESQLPLTAGDHTALKTAAAALKPASLRVCGDPGNLPLSDINRAGYQNKIIELVASEVGAQVHYFWRPYLMRGITRQTFDTNDCDVLLDMPATGFAGGIITTNPVYKTTYVLAYRSDKGIEIKSLDDPALKTLKIGVFQTSGLRTAFNRRGIIQNVTLHVVSHNADLKPENQPWQQVQKVVDGHLDVAGVWGPFAGWVKTMKGEPLTVVPTNLWEDEIPQEFELAIGLRKVDWVLKYKLDLALEARRAEIEKILRDYGVPLVQCSKCTVPGDLPAHGAYTKILASNAPARSEPIAEDQKVTRERLEAWLSDGADLQQELSNAVLAADIERIKFLVSQGADVNKLDKQGYTALHSAARNRDDAVLAALLALKADVAAVDSDGFTALHHAVLRNHPPSIAVLAGGGVEMDQRTKDGFTPLALAIIEDQFKAAMALIAAKAPVETTVGEAKLTPLMLAAGKESRRLTLGAGVSRVEKFNPKDPGPIEIAKALIDRGASVNAISNSGVSALILAAAHNNSPIVGLLAEAGADRNFRGPDGKTASDIAGQNGNTAVVSLLKLLDQATSN